MKMLRGLVLFVAIFFIAKFSFAADAYWNDRMLTHSWSESWNWDRDGYPVVPVDGDNVYLMYSLSGNYTVNYDTNNLSLNSMLVNGGINLNLPNNLTVVNSETIGSYVVSSAPSQSSVLSHSSGANIVGGDLILGVGSGSHGVYELGNSSGISTPILTAKAINVGGEGFGEFVMNRGSLTIGNTTDGWLGIDSSSDDGESTFFLNGGTINKLSGEIKIGGDHKGYFVQAGGDFTYAGAMYLGDKVFGYVDEDNPGTPSEGVYTMSGGTLTGGGICLGEWGGVGRFIQSGGVVDVTDFFLGRQYPIEGPGQGYYYMNSGTGDEPELYVDWSNIGTRGIGVFEQNAGWHEVEGNMGLGVEAGSEGTYNLNGGSLTVGGTLTVKQTLSQPGAGTFNMAGGALTAGTIVNNDLFNVHDAGNLMSPLLIRGDIENNGEFRVTNAMVNFDGDFINNARFISDPSVMAFDNLEVTSDGIIHAGLDEYHINGSFKNKSVKNIESAEWFTRNAQLIFSPGSHEAMFNSQDLGALESAYNNNFAWGNVDFGGADFTLLAQGGDSWGALYTGTVGGLNIENGIIQNEFIGNSNIYYLAQYNPLLGGKPYDFVSGSGKFIPVNVVPEPISSALFLLGAGALAGVRKLRGE